MKTNFYYLSIALTFGSLPFIRPAPKARRSRIKASCSRAPISAHGIYNFTFSLYNTNSGGAAIAPTVTKQRCGCDQRLFTVLVDFGSNVVHRHELLVGDRRGNQQRQSLHHAGTAPAIDAPRRMRFTRRVWLLPALLAR